MLKINDFAPDFSLQDGEGKTISLKQFKGKSVVIYFYPKDDTPGCTAEACSFRDSYSAYLNKGIVVLGISKDNVSSHKKFAQKYSLPFPLLSDPTLETCKKYDAFGTKKRFGITYQGILRKTFLIDKEGKITQIIEKVNCKTHATDILNQ